MNGAETPGQAVRAAFLAVVQRRGGDSAEWHTRWDDLPQDLRDDWEGIAQAGHAIAAAQGRPAPGVVADAVADATYAFAKDEILANAGPEWDRPLVPETNAIEYVRHLEAQAARLAVTAAERDDLAAELDKLKRLLDGFTRIVILARQSVRLADAARGVREEAGMTIVDEFSRETA